MGKKDTPIVSCEKGTKSRKGESTGLGGGMAEGRIGHLNGHVIRVTGS